MEGFPLALCPGLRAGFCGDFAKMKNLIILSLITVLLFNQGAFALAMNDIIDSRTKIKVGELIKDEVWEGKVFLIGDVTIPLGKKLIIKPGTQVIFDERDIMESGQHRDQVELIAYGTIEADASTVNPIRMVSISGLNAKKLVELGDSVRIIRFAPYKIDTASMTREFRSFKHNYFIVWALIYGMWVFARNI